MQLWPYPCTGDTSLLLTVCWLSSSPLPSRLKVELFWATSDSCPHTGWCQQRRCCLCGKNWSFSEHPSSRVSNTAFCSGSLCFWVPSCHSLPQQANIIQERPNTEMERGVGSLKSDSPWKLKVNDSSITKGTWCTQGSYATSRISSTEWPLAFQLQLYYSRSAQIMLQVTGG